MSRLYECISEMEKGSQSGYDAETGEESAGSENALGEPNKQPSLYRIRRSQENYQLLPQDGGGRGPGRGHDRVATERAARLGGGSATLAGSHGSDLVQWLDLRHSEALQRGSGDGTSGEDESHQRGQEEERPHRCRDHRRPGALQPAARLLCSSSAD